MSSALCRTNSFGQRSVFPTTPVASSTSVFSADAPRISPLPRSGSTSLTNPNVRAPASSDANVSSSTIQRPFCAPTSGCAKSIDTSRSKHRRRDARRTPTRRPPPARVRGEPQLVRRAAVPDHAGRRERVEERPCAAVEDRRLGRVHLDDDVVDARADDRREHVLHRVQAAVAVAELRAALGQRRVRPRRAGVSGLARRDPSGGRRCPLPTAAGTNASVHSRPRCRPTPRELGARGGSSAARSLLLPREQALEAPASSR